MTADRRPRSWVPWVLCWISLGLLFVGVGLRIAFSEETDGGVFRTVIQIPGYALVPLVGALVAARLPTNAYGWLAWTRAAPVCATRSPPPSPPRASRCCCAAPRALGPEP